MEICKVTIWQTDAVWFYIQKCCKKYEICEDSQRTIRRWNFSCERRRLAFDIADSIASVINEYQGNKFDDLWVYVETMLGNKLLSYHDEADEYEIEGQYGIEKGCNVYRQYYINIWYQKGSLKCQNYTLLEMDLIKDMD